MLQRSVVEVGAECDDDPDPAVLVGDRLHEGVEEMRGDTGRNLGEQLLELVDHEEQL